MRLLLLLVLFIWPAFCQTIIKDTIFRPISGGLFEGEVVIEAPDMVWNGTSVRRETKSILVQRGQLVVSLLPSGASSPEAGLAYVVTFKPRLGPSWKEYWHVPATLSELKVWQVSRGSQPSTTSAVSLWQISGARGQGGRYVCSDNSSVTWCAPPAFAGGGGLGFRKVFSATTQLSISAEDHGYAHGNLMVTCQGQSGATVEPDYFTVDPSTFAVAIAFASPQAGTCIVHGAAQSYSLAFTGQTSVTLAASAHKLRSVTGIVCFSGSNRAIQTGPITFTPTAVNVGGSMGISHNITIAFATNQSGRCAALGV